MRNHFQTIDQLNEFAIDNGLPLTGKRPIGEMTADELKAARMANNWIVGFHTDVRKEPYLLSVDREFLDVSLLAEAHAKAVAESSITVGSFYAFRLYCKV
jgi:hypothetical protein